MAEPESADVSRQEFSVAYDGALRAEDHSIDVQTLAPALLAFGRLLKEGNAAFNGKRAAAKVRVVSDFQHKCFNINFELVLSWIQHVKTLIGDDNVKTAKEVLEWIGLIGGPTVLGRVSYLQYLKWKKGREVVEERTHSDDTGTVTVTVKGDNNSVVVDARVLALSKNPKALRATKETFLPLGQDGFETMRVEGSDVERETFEPAEIDDIVRSCEIGLEDAKEEPEPDIETTSAWLSVYSPVYDVKADNWRFRLGRDVIYADITETTIAQEALARGGALSEDAYQVRLEITTPFDPQGKPKQPSYKIIEVTRFVAATPAVQTSFLDSDGGSSDSR